MAIKLTPLSETLGAEVEGLDIDHISREDAEALHAAFLKYHVLVIHGPVISDERLIAFGKCFGTIEKARLRSPLASSPEIMVITNIRRNGEPVGSLPDGELTFHFDRVHQTIPNKAGVLHMIETPDRGGDTLFADMTAAYRALPEETRRRLEGLTALNTYQYGRTHKDDKQLSEDTPSAVHPVVRTIPETGEKALYVSRLMTDRILELDEDEGQALLEEICDYAEQPRFTYTHHWRPGDILIWDNRCLMHARTDFDGRQRRLAKRVTVGDDTPPLP